VTIVERKGFGSAVLEIVMADCYGEWPQIEFANSGVIYQLTAPLDAILGANGDARLPQPPG
jgi:hypothetical protein